MHFYKDIIHNSIINLFYFLFSLRYPDNHPANPEINKLMATTSYADICLVK